MIAEIAAGGTLTAVLAIIGIVIKNQNAKIKDIENVKLKEINEKKQDKDMCKLIEKNVEKDFQKGNIQFEKIEEQITAQARSLVTQGKDIALIQQSIKTMVSTLARIETKVNNNGGKH